MQLRILTNQCEAADNALSSIPHWMTFLFTQMKHTAMHLMANSFMPSNLGRIRDFSLTSP